MHSSRMRTDRSLTVCWSLLPGGGGLLREGCLLLGGYLLWGFWCRGGVSAPGGAWSQGCVSAPRGVCLCSQGGVSAPWGRGGISQRALRQTPSPPVDRQSPVKILPWPNFVAASKNGNDHHRIVPLRGGGGGNHGAKSNFYSPGFTEFR